MESLFAYSRIITKVNKTVKRKHFTVEFIRAVSSKTNKAIAFKDYTPKFQYTHLIKESPYRLSKILKERQNIEPSNINYQIIQAIRFIFLLKTDRIEYIKDAIEILGISQERGQRLWKKYKEKGLDAILNPPTSVIQIPNYSALIKESPEELQSLASTYKNKGIQKKLLFLMHLKQDRKATQKKAVQTVGLSKKQGNSIWKKYKEKGLGAILNPPASIIQIPNYSALIKESPEELQSLASSCKNKNIQKKLLFLMHLKQDRKATQRTVAQTVGLSKKQGNSTWKKYKEKGLQVFIQKQ